MCGNEGGDGVRVGLGVKVVRVIGILLFKISRFIRKI